MFDVFRGILMLQLDVLPWMHYMNLSETIKIVFRDGQLIWKNMTHDETKIQIQISFKELYNSEFIQVEIASSW